MQIAVLSDIHLGERNKLDQFCRNDGAYERLHELLTYLENHVDKIVLLGDIFETLRGKGYSKEKTLVKILKQYPGITSKIMDNEKYELIAGNHDPVTTNLLNAREMIKIKDGDNSIAFFHGHQLDPLVVNPFEYHFERVFVWLGGWMERMGFDITHRLNLVSKAKSLTNRWHPDMFERAAAELGASMGCNVVVTGHSHHPMKVEYGDTLFLNSGTRVAARQDLVIIDTAMNQYDVHKQFNVSSQND